MAATEVPAPAADPRPLAIEARGIGKRYRLFSDSGRGRLMDRVGGLLRPGTRDPYEDAYVWALRGVSFDLHTGEIKAVLGRNGSGKTTLMRVLARVTAPTEGRARVHGRIGALFQVGTGFHPELSGRENIMLSGAILGMDAERTAELYESIVEFSEIGDFIDMPVKRYSSGMYTRLAFSVSAHLAVDVMLVDEVLGVGDARFQEKSKAYIRSMIRDGRSVLYVSHSMDAVREICDSAMVLEDGGVIFDGSTDEAISVYEQMNQQARSKVRDLQPAR